MMLLYWFEGIGMNSAFAIAHLCEEEAGLRNVLAAKESAEMVSHRVVIISEK